MKGVVFKDFEEIAGGRLRKRNASQRKLGGAEEVGHIAVPTQVAVPNQAAGQHAVSAGPVAHGQQTEARDAA